MISASTSMWREPSAIPQTLIETVSQSCNTKGLEGNIHGIDSPEDESESCNSREESCSLLVLALNSSTSIEAQLVDNDQVRNTGNGIPSPLGTLLNLEGGKQTGKNHDDISNDGDKDVGSCKTGEEAEIEEQEGSGDAPVDIAGPVDLTVDDLLDIWDAFLGVVGM